MEEPGRPGSTRHGGFAVVAGAAGFRHAWYQTGEQVTPTRQRADAYSVAAMSKRIT